MDNFQIETAQNISINQNIANISTRIAAHLIDALFIAAYYFCIIFILFLLNIKTNSHLLSVISLLSIPIFFYSLLFETLMNGQTPGKYFSKIRVVKLDGSTPTFGNYLLRWILRFIDFSLTSGGVAILSILLTGKGQRLGDIAAGTTVISEKIKITLNDTIANDILDDYTPSYPQATLLSDKDISIIKELYSNAKSKGNHRTIIKLHEKIISITDIKTTQKPIYFVDTIIKDYHYYTQKH